MSNYFNKFIEDLKVLMKFDSENREQDNSPYPFGKEINDCLIKTISICEKLGFKTKNNNGYYALAELGNFEETLGIFGHIDVVPANKELWTHDPYGAHIVDDVFYGRGLIDDKGPTLACLFATKELLEDKSLVQKRNIQVFFGCDEETGMRCITKFAEEEKQPTLAFTPDANFPCVNCEKGVLYAKFSLPLPENLIYIKGGNKENMVMAKVTCILLNDKNIDFKDTKDIKVEKMEDGNIKLTSIGKSSHASMPENGINAFHLLLNYLSKLDDRYTGLKNLLCNTDGKPLSINSENKETGKLTISWNLVSSENNLLNIKCDIRFPNSITKDDLLKNMSLKFNSKAYDISSVECLYKDPNSELVSTLCNVYNRYTNQNLKPLIVGGGTYSKSLDNCVAFGPQSETFNAHIHEIDERASMYQLKAMYNIYKEAIKELAFTKK